jgi:arylformamidase
VNDLDRQYSPSTLVPDAGAVLAGWTARSAATRAALPGRLDLRYGPGLRSTVDVFPARPGAPLLVFVHGGFWQELSKDDVSFPAAGAVAAGVGYAALGYPLAPERDLDEIVASVRAGLWWLVAQAPDAAGIYLCGHSAGAHLVAMALLAGWPPDGRAPADVFAGAVLVSGVYDLEPIRHTYVNRPLGLDRAAAARNSPIRALPDRLPPLVLACGEIETAEFHRQQRDFAAAARARGGPVTELLIPDRNHFDILDDLTDPATTLGHEVLSLVNT